MPHARTRRTELWMRWSLARGSGLSIDRDATITAEVGGVENEPKAACDLVGRLPGQGCAPTGLGSRRRPWARFSSSWARRLGITASEPATALRWFIVGYVRAR